MLLVLATYKMLFIYVTFSLNDLQLFGKFIHISDKKMLERTIWYSDKKLPKQMFYIINDPDYKVFDRNVLFDLVFCCHLIIMNV